MFGLHEVSNEISDFVRLGIERKVACVEYVDLSVGYILSVPLRFAKVEGEIVFTPDD